MGFWLKLHRSNLFRQHRVDAVEKGLENVAEQ
jgi:hypothetical protein